MSEKIRIHINNVRSYLSHVPDGLDEELSCYHDNYKFSPKYKGGLWDGKTHFLYKKSFPTGLVHKVCAYMTTKNINESTTAYQILDEREKPTNEPKTVTKDFLDGIELREEQVEAANTAILKSRGIIKMATGTGKTEVAVAITKAINVNKTLFVVNSKTLLHQTKDRYLKRLPDLQEGDIGLFGDGHKEDGKIVVATAQSFDALKKRDFGEFKEYLQGFDCLIMDECHHSSAKTWYQIAMFTNAYYRFGFSGTPLNRPTLDNMKLTGAIGRMIYELTTQDAIAKDMLCPITVTMIPITKTFHFQKYSTVYTEGIVKCEPRNNKIIRAAVDQFGEKKKVLILVRYIEHGKILNNMLEEMQFPVIWLNGKHTQKEREAQICKFVRTPAILIGSGIFDEGVDIPAINCLIIAAGGKSDMKTIQRIGRGLRKKVDRSSLEVFDFIDASKFLCDHSKQRMSIYKQEGYLHDDK